MNVAKPFFHLLLRSWAGACFALALFSVVYLAGSDDWYEVSKGLSQMPLGYIFLGYGFICSVLIEALSGLMPKRRRFFRWLLYALAGYAFFGIGGFHPLAVLAGSIAALSALVCAAGVVLADKNRWFRYGVAILVPVLLLVLINTDFTEKRGWTENGTENGFAAHFDYFNGEHEIPLQLEEGQTVRFYFDFQSKNGGGHGHTILDEKGRYAGMRETGDGWYEVNVEKSGVYRVVVQGLELSGSIEVKWEITEKEDG